MIELSPYRTIMDVNYFGSVYSTFHALPYLKQSGGRIVAISSLAGKSGVPTRSGYAASKHAMVGFFDTIRIELSQHNISVTIIYPDFVTSQIRSRAFGSDGKPIGISPVLENQIMATDKCAELILKAAERRKRELIIGMRGKLGVWLKMFFPELVDSIALNAINRGK